MSFATNINNRHSHSHSQSHRQRRREHLKPPKHRQGLQRHKPLRLSPSHFTASCIILSTHSVAFHSLVPSESSASHKMRLIAAILLILLVGILDQHCTTAQSGYSGSGSSSNSYPSASNSYQANYHSATRTCVNNNECVYMGSASLCIDGTCKCNTGFGLRYSQQSQRCELDENLIEESFRFSRGFSLTILEICLMCFIIVMALISICVCIMQSQKKGKLDDIRYSPPRAA